MEHDYRSFEIHLHPVVVKYIKGVLGHHERIKLSKFDYMFRVDNIGEEITYDLCKILFDNNIPFSICCIEKGKQLNIHDFTYRFDGECYINEMTSSIFIRYRFANDKELEQIKQFELMEHI